MTTTATLDSRLAACRSDDQANTIYCNISINGSLLPVKTDTWAQVNAMPLQVFYRLHHKPPLRPTPIQIKPFAVGNTVKLSGIMILNLRYKDVKDAVDFVIIDAREVTLLGCQASGQLRIIKVDAVDSVQVTTDDSSSQLINEYANVFKGIGCMPGEHHITTDQSVPPEMRQGY